MLKIRVPEGEFFDEKTNEFIYTKGQELALEHSLVSISKWEAIFNKPYISTSEKTIEEIMEYIKCMTITQNVNPLVYKSLSAENIRQIKDYIDSPMSATTFAKKEGAAPSREILTSELIYYYMIAYQIPFDCEKWHLNRLINLIKICSIKNAPKKKMKKGEILAMNSSLNAARRKATGSNG